MVRRQRVIRTATPEEDRLADIAAAEEGSAISANRRMIARADAARAAINEVVTTLRTARENAGLSLIDVQTRSGITRNNLCRIENLKGSCPTFATLERYAEAVGCRLELNVIATDRDARSENLESK